MSLLNDNRFRQSLSTWLALYPLLTLILWGLATPLAAIPLPLRTLLLTAFLVPVLVYGCVPWTRRLVDRLLPVSDPTDRRLSSAGGDSCHPSASTPLAK